MIPTNFTAFRPEFANVEDLNIFFDDLGELLNSEGYDAGNIIKVNPADYISITAETDPKLIKRMIREKVVRLANSNIIMLLKLDDQRPNWSKLEETADARIYTMTLETITALAKDSLIERYKESNEAYFIDLLHLDQQALSNQIQRATVTQ